MRERRREAVGGRGGIAGREMGGGPSFMDSHTDRSIPVLRRGEKPCLGCPGCRTTCS